MVCGMEGSWRGDSALQNPWAKIQNTISSELKEQSVYSPASFKFKGVILVDRLRCQDTVQGDLNYILSFGGRCFASGHPRTVASVGRVVLREGWLRCELQPNPTQPKTWTQTQTQQSFQTVKQPPAIEPLLLYSSAEQISTRPIQFYSNAFGNLLIFWRAYSFENPPSNTSLESSLEQLETSHNPLSNHTVNRPRTILEPFLKRPSTTSPQSTLSRANEETQLRRACGWHKRFVDISLTTRYSRIYKNSRDGILCIVSCCFVYHRKSG